MHVRVMVLGFGVCISLFPLCSTSITTTYYTGTSAKHIAETVEGLRLLIAAKANVNARNSQGFSALMLSCVEERLHCVHMLVEGKADLNVKAPGGYDAIYSAMLRPTKNQISRQQGLVFAVLSCDTDSKSILLDVRKDVTQAMVDAHVRDYRQVHTFIDACHTATKHALSEDVVVDTRVGRGDFGLYHEPLERVMEYLGLSMKIDQTVNASIDGKSKRRALIPRNINNANIWYQHYQRTHCSNCSTQPAKLMKCTCDTARYCNSDCQRKHWNTHKIMHKRVIQHLKLAKSHLKL
jgi:hypothetical protein